MQRRIISGPDLLPLQVQENLSLDRRRESLEAEMAEFAGTGGESCAYVTFLGKGLQVSLAKWEAFREKFSYCLKGNTLTFDNLVNICIMVKDAGPGFGDILTQNLPFADRWTILDTGSTDGTIDVIHEVLKGKRYDLYEEPFINFRDSRNRLLDLAGDSCHFNVMLDDTYVLHGNLREFLGIARGDDVADSFTLTIDGGDTLYGSNRVTKPSRGLRYINVIHEVIEANLNVSIPYPGAWIEDVRSEYMTGRTSERKLQDIALLEQMHLNDPSDARPLYYLGDSYLGLKDWEKSLHWFKKRAEMGGYGAELQDALYYVAVLSHHKLDRPWSECHDLYLRCYDADPTRADTIYFIGKHYLDAGMLETGMLYMEKAFSLGMPEIQMSVRKDIYNFHIPNDMLIPCYKTGRYQLGYDAATKIIKHKEDDDNARQWQHILWHLTQVVPIYPKQRLSEKELIVMVSAGGLTEWDGSTLRTQGLGGSEQFMIRYSEKLVELGFDVMLFCKRTTGSIYNGVVYRPTEEFVGIIGKMDIKACFVHRHPEFVPVTAINGIPTYFVMHDILSAGVIIPTHENLKKVLCISNWHAEEFCKFYPTLSGRVEVAQYGIDTMPLTQHEEFNFIFPSFPNRGLLQVLQMWPRIIERYPQSRLNCFVDTKHAWTREHHGSMMDQIEVLLDRFRDTVTNHGWQPHGVIKEAWGKAHVFLYPSIFVETCCLSAMEAQASRTLIVTNHLGGLRDTVGDRGVVVYGDASTVEWQDEAFEKMFDVLEGRDTSDYIGRAYDWSLAKSYDTVVPEFAEKYL